jgi:hypothetical protein
MLKSAAITFSHLLPVWVADEDMSEGRHYSSHVLDDEVEHITSENIFGHGKPHICVCTIYVSIGRKVEGYRPRIFSAT